MFQTFSTKIDQRFPVYTVCQLLIIHCVKFVTRKHASLPSFVRIVQLIKRRHDILRSVASWKRKEHLLRDQSIRRAPYKGLSMSMDYLLCVHKGLHNFFLISVFQAVIKKEIRDLITKQTN